MKEMQPHILLIDGMALLFRSFYATAPMRQFFPRQDGTPTNGVQGFARHVLSAQNIVRPTHMAVCWDMGSHTFRNDLFDGYKANRTAPPEEMLPQFDMARDVSELIGWKNFGVKGQEADDLIGSIVEKWKNDAQITVVSGDKDLLQLVNPNTTIALTKKGYTEYNPYNLARFTEEYGISPAQFADVKAFMGDSSDGYPGVKGIGPKTALQLIQTYGSVDGVLAALAELKPGQRQKISDNVDMLQLSLQLARINTAVPIDASMDELLLPMWTNDTLDLMHQHEYRLIANHALNIFK
ncbi:5'-3' exonuclease [Kurthia sp. 3B1D]|uniref:5'-3' exonuclease n=1 Tax=Candidatus Kurthia intestinigallinarum TaxID=1562256 RepID=A0A433RWH1_9BACL|nr:5'-3' exonuclease H3TH domain-containing protein [Kurthia sp. 3B1D]RUS57623.1 5'-3' exonuclease [Kurthia sp. 3B1D]